MVPGRIGRSYSRSYIIERGGGVAAVAAAVAAVVAAAAALAAAEGAGAGGKSSWRGVRNWRGPPSAVASRSRLARVCVFLKLLGP